ncbi:amidase [Chelatococcus reniformis]|uniref:Amidase n=1 Tax=Chelatococcus reniformis TaxID=1494448 RepID=A0A916UVB4_9HYPH|nr:amidase family protein [Chelatococcus reniformis]GGC86873.1 amidase [Chelatococcus reniformis]
MHEPDLQLLTTSDLVRLYRQRQLSPVEVMDGYLARIERLNPGLNAFVLVDPERARAEARRAEDAFMGADEPPLLAGLPVSVKDNIMTAGLRSTSGSPLFADHVPQADAGVVAAVRRTGGIVVGKTNTPAFGWTGSTDNKLFGPTPNPHDRTVTAGGSSGGAAVSAAAALAPVNIGTDGGGSLRTPAAFTGTVGFKPSHGRLADVPAHPHWLMQHYGPIGRTVADVALVLEAAAGPHPADPHSLPRGADDFVAATQSTPCGLKVLFTTQLGFVEAVDPEIEALCREAATALAELGWTIVERDLDWPDPAAFANTLSAVGFAWRLGDHLDRRDDIEDGILAILDHAAALPPNAFYDAYLERNRWCAHPLGLFEAFDLLVTPTTAAPPFPVGTLAPATIGGRAVPPSAWSPYLRPFNLTGQPAISVPAGRTRAGLPVGLQIVGPRCGDARVLAAAAAFERLRPWPMWHEAGV